MERFTDATYWEENWWNRQRPRPLRWLYRDQDFEAVQLLAGKPKDGLTRVIEVGAGASRILPYLSRKFGFAVFGSDFSLRGCRLARANGALQRVDSAVVCEDLFQSSLAPETFDLVYSSGLIEHFDDTRAVANEHLRLVRPGGRLVLIVPNLLGIQGKIWKRLALPFWKIHRVFGPEDLEAMLKGLGLSGVRSGYLGSFFIHVGLGNEWVLVRSWPGWFRFFVCASVRVANGLTSLFFRLSPWRPHTRALSPLFFAEGIKPAV